MTDFQIKKIAIIGQGYVGLPLALAFSEFFPVIGFDINKTRIAKSDESNLWKYSFLL